MSDDAKAFLIYLAAFFAVTVVALWTLGGAR